jgi:DDE superfamily endonuclease
LVVDKKTLKVICTDVGKGRRHDFYLYKSSSVHATKETEIVVDTGYQGLQKIHEKTLKPTKRSKKKPLLKSEKKINHSISSVRVAVEHVIRRIKIFRIIAERYRNRRKRFTLRLNLISALYNFEL